ncbi:hypothetical protein CDAR_167271 [Caerostris darwini]|uniref:Uncharacterized protein n=1 Tax=Caerostris darwini TaxID=1538125 RepID=A0AAV4X649_9ARAC|nr:hypothetical protein CDAR_167271 [Caerostris darwini]
MSVLYKYHLLMLSRSVTESSVCRPDGSRRRQAFAYDLRILLPNFVKQAAVAIFKLVNSGFPAHLHRKEFHHRDSCPVQVSFAYAYCHSLYKELSLSSRWSTD